MTQAIESQLKHALARAFRPLGEGPGRGHNKYVSRWKTKTGVPIVSENLHPNVWIPAKFLFSLGAPDASRVAFEQKNLTAPDRGFHSNVLETPHMGNPVAKLSPLSESDIGYLIDLLSGQFRA
jgi:hypothetical protein